MKDISFVLDMEPPRHTAQQKGARAIVGADGRAFVLHYRKREVVDIERTYAVLLRPHAPRIPLSGPVAVSFGFYYPATQDGAARMKRAGVSLRRKRTKPDADNVCKSLLDCMTRAGFWTDDSEIALLHAEKFETTDRPRIAVRVRELAQYPGELFADVDQREAIEPN